MLWPSDAEIRERREIEILGLVGSQMLKPKGHTAPARGDRQGVLNERFVKFAGHPKEFVLEATENPWLCELVTPPVPLLSDCVTTGLVALTRILLKRARGRSGDGSQNKAAYFLEQHLGGLQRGGESLVPKHDNDMVVKCAGLASVSHFWSAYLLLAKHWHFERLSHKNLKTFLAVAQMVSDELAPVLKSKAEPWLLPKDLPLPVFALPHVANPDVLAFLERYTANYETGPALR